MHKPFSVIVNAADKSAEILLYGDIGGFDWDTWKEINTAKLFRDELNSLEAAGTTHINVRINSYGGYVSEGLAISNAIAQSKIEIHTWIDGVAMSMAAMIAMSGKQIHMAKNGILMIHNAWTWTYGNASDLRKEADVLDTYDRSLILMMVDKTGKTEEEIRSQYFNFEDHYFNADQALELGLINVVEGYEAEATPSIENARNEGYLKVAAKFRQKTAASGSKETMMQRIRSYSSQQEPMNLVKLQAAIADGRIALADADKTAITEEISAALKEGDIITATEFHAQGEELTNATTALEAIRAAAGEGDPVAIINQLRTDLEAAQATLAEAAAIDPAVTNQDSEPSGELNIEDLPHNKAAAEKLKNLY